MNFLKRIFGSAARAQDTSGRPSPEAQTPAPPVPATRTQYKAVWNELAHSYDSAKMHVIGSTSEDEFTGTSITTLNILLRTVGIRPDDVVLEIGCGIGRVGRALSPRCLKWIGCDVSPMMLGHARNYLAAYKNVELRELSGYNLAGIDDASTTVVYSTVVFMHLESWDRFMYVTEAFRVLKPGGRIYIDNANLCSEGGWKVFEVHRQFPPGSRPPHMTECSTPQELETYLQRAGFENIQLLTEDDFVRAWATKP